MSRRQLILFAILVIIAITFLSLHENTKLQVSSHMSSVVLFPVKEISEFIHFLSVSNTRITELESLVNRLRLENSELKTTVVPDTTAFTPVQFTVRKARVIGRDPSNINGYLYVDKGHNDNLSVNQPVISVNGLVGKVKFVGPEYSIIETLENPGFAISALDVNTGVYGIIKQKDNLYFDFIKMADDVKVGDTIQTSGMSEIFPSGILIGTITRITSGDDLFFKPIVVAPSVRINRLTHVYIVFGTAAKHPIFKEYSINHKQYPQPEPLIPR